MAAGGPAVHRRRLRPSRPLPRPVPPPLPPVGVRQRAVPARHRVRVRPRLPLHPLPRRQPAGVAGPQEADVHAAGGGVVTDWLQPVWVWAVSIALAYIAIHTSLTHQTLRELLALLTEDDPDDDDIDCEDQP